MPTYTDPTSGRKVRSDSELTPDELEEAFGHAQNFGTTAAEAVGGSLGAAVGGPIGAGVGTVAGGTLGDVISGRPLTLRGEATRFVTGAAGEAVAGPVLRFAGEGAGALTRAAASRFPAIGRAAEAIAPGVLRTTERAAEATGGGLSRIPAGRFGKVELNASIDRFGQYSEAAFRHLENLAGPLPVVPTSELQSAMSRFGPPRGILSRQGEEALERAMAPGTGISFRDARLLESEFGRLGYGQGAQLPVGTLPQHELRELHEAVGRDLESFLSSSGVDPTLPPEVARVKGEYGEARELLNKTVIKNLTEKGAKASKFLSQGFNDAENVQALKKALPGDVFDDLVNSRLAADYDLAHVNGRFDPRVFAGRINRYEQGEQLQYMVTPERRADLLKMRDEFFRMGQTSPLFARGLAGEVLRYGLRGAALGAGGMEAYQRYSGRPGPMEQYQELLGPLTATFLALDPAGRKFLRYGLPQMGAQYAKPFGEP